jgi:hypothetical protein
VSRVKSANIATREVVVPSDAPERLRDTQCPYATEITYLKAAAGLISSAAFLAAAVVVLFLCADAGGRLHLW